MQSKTLTYTLFFMQLFLYEQLNIVLYIYMIIMYTQLITKCHIRSMIIIYRSNICSDLLSARNEIKKVKGTEQGSYGKAKKQS